MDSEIAEHKIINEDLHEFFERLKREYEIDYIDDSLKGEDLYEAYREKVHLYEFMLAATLWYGLERYPHRQHLRFIDATLNEIKRIYPEDIPFRTPIDTEMASDPDPDIQAFMIEVREWMIQNGYLRLTGGGRGRRRTITGRNKKLKRRTHRN